MRKHLLLGLLAGCALAGSPVAAQTNCPDGDSYIVKQDDNLYNLSQLHLGNPELWQELRDLNPVLNEAWRWRERSGHEIILIYPGEELCGLHARNIVPYLASDVAASPAGPPPSNEVGDAENDSAYAWLLTAVIVLMIGAILWTMYRRRESDPDPVTPGLDLDPVTSGPPIVDGGVNSDEQVEQRFAEMARTARPDTDIVSIGERTTGFGYGVINVRYADGRVEPRRLNAHRMYRANVRFRDGSEQQLYMLQQCGNDVTFSGTRYQEGDDFRFVVNRDEEERVAAEPAATEPAAEASEEVAEDELVEGESQIQFEPAHGDQPTILRISGLDVSKGFTFSLGPNGATLRLKPPKRPRSR